MLVVADDGELFLQGPVGLEPGGFQRRVDDPGGPGGGGERQGEVLVAAEQDGRAGPGPADVDEDRAAGGAPDVGAAGPREVVGGEAGAQGRRGDREDRVASPGRRQAAGRGQEAVDLLGRVRLLGVPPVGGEEPPGVAGEPAVAGPGERRSPDRAVIRVDAVRLAPGWSSYLSTGPRSVLALLHGHVVAVRHGRAP
jgi:hypothetical protein